MSRRCSSDTDFTMMSSEDVLKTLENPRQILHALKRRISKENRRSFWHRRALHCWSTATSYFFAFSGKNNTKKGRVKNLATNSEYFPVCDRFHKTFKSWWLFQVRKKVSLLVATFFTLRFFCTVKENTFRRAWAFSRTNSDASLRRADVKLCFDVKIMIEYTW